MLYSIGKVVQTHGIKGEVKIKPHTDFDRFVKGSDVIIQDTKYKIQTVREQKDLLLVSFVGYPTLTDVEHLKQQEIYTDEEPLDLESDAFHLPKLIGLKVYDQHNYLIGTVLELVDVPQGYLLRILRDDNGKTVLIPFIDKFIKSVDETSIHIETIEGLIWLLILLQSSQTSLINF